MEGVIERELLGELRVDQQRVRAFEFYTDKIISGQIGSVVELGARLNQRFEPGFERQGDLASEDGTGLKGSDRRVIKVSEGERIAVSDTSDQLTLLELFESFGVESNDRQQARGSINRLELMRTMFQAFEDVRVYAPLSIRRLDIPLNFRLMIRNIGALQELSRRHGVDFEAL